MDTHEYSSNQQGYFTWAEAIQHGNAMSGYHLPTKEEWMGIFADYNSGNNIRFSKVTSADNVEEAIEINGATQTYQADYRSLGNGTAYAIKMKGHGEVNRTAYRYRLLNTNKNDIRLVVDAIYLGVTNSADINAVSQPSFWTSPDATREFWNAGFRGGSTGRGLYGYFWSATPDSSNGAWSMRVNISSMYMEEYYTQSESFTVRLFEGDGTTPLPFTEPTITSVTQKQSNWTADANSPTITTQNNNTQIGVKNTENYLVLDVTGGNAHSTASVTSNNSSWVTIDDNVVKGSYNNEFRVRVQPNTTNATRTATIEITNANDNTKKVEVTITQEATTVPPTARPKLALEYVAEHNLDPTGRAFTTTHEYANDQQGYFTWQEAVQHGNAMSGYHLPSQNEWRGIFGDYNKGNNIRFDTTASADNVDEEITLNGTT